VARLAAELPGLTVVVDHLGKPPRGRDDYDSWARCLREVADRPNAVAKVSGLQLAGQPLSAEALRPVWDLALAVFGPERLMFGSDWPMTVSHGGYPAAWSVARELAGSLSPDERQQFFVGTATTVYQLDLRRSRCFKA
jgi:L-fuconolactonase